jgi:hypothetical protein
MTFGKTATSARFVDSCSRFLRMPASFCTCIGFTKMAQSSHPAQPDASPSPGVLRRMRSLCNYCVVTTMRRLLSILLFGATLFPSIAPLLSSGAMAESRLPACCRRAGKHHCGMIAEERAMTMGDNAKPSPKSARFTPPLEKCPYGQRSVAPTPLQGFTSATIATQAAANLEQPAPAARAECLRRISFDRSRQKRGPPALLS